MKLAKSLLRKRHFAARARIVVALVLLGAASAQGYSVLTHEQVVDLVWQDQIVPKLRHRFPQATDDEIKKAHAYAYGGSMLQDMGYYPFGNKLFSDLTHYVRTGDFVVNMLHGSSDVNEYAFALGALAHYVSDNAGHPTINRVVAIEFPKLRKKYGNLVTYEDDHKAHIRTEFGFDMVQVAKNRYTSDRYHDFIGFEISKPLLDRTFQKTYGIKTTDVIGDEDLAIGTFRRAISKVIPEMARVALLARKKEMVKEDPTFDRKKFLYYLSRTNYEKEWGKGYRRPGTGARILAFFLKAVPKVGPFSALKFQIPSTPAEDMCIKSVTETVEVYKGQLRRVDSPDLQLENRDCDTGEISQFGTYTLSDATYAKLLDKLAEHNFDQISMELRANILQYYADAGNPDPSAKEKTTAASEDKKSRAKTEKELERLRNYSGDMVSENEVVKSD